MRDKHTTQIQHILFDAADAAQRRGWAKDKLIASDGRVCLVGAISATVTANYNDRLEAADVMAATCQTLDSYLGQSADSYNDRYIRDAAHAQQVLGQAAMTLE